MVYLLVLSLDTGLNFTYFESLTPFARKIFVCVIPFEPSNLQQVYIFHVQFFLSLLVSYRFPVLPQFIISFLNGFDFTLLKYCIFVPFG